jgi:hypothetical protein
VVLATSTLAAARVALDALDALDAVPAVPQPAATRAAADRAVAHARCTPRMRRGGAGADPCPFRVAVCSWCFMASILVAVDFDVVLTGNYGLGWNMTSTQ